MNTNAPRPNWQRIALSLGWRVAVIVAAVWLLHGATDWLIQKAEATQRGNMMMVGVLIVLILAYALMLAMPFVPGIEIGLALLALKGAEVAPWIYLGTVAGLFLGFLAGHFLPYDWLEFQLRRLRLVPLADLVAELGVLNPAERLALLEARAPRAVARLALNWRYVLLALLYNLPGSGLIGGGGGISLVTGLSRIFLPWPTLATIAVAVAPVPLFFWWMGPR